MGINSIPVNSTFMKKFDIDNNGKLENNEITAFNSTKTLNNGESAQFQRMFKNKHATVNMDSFELVDKIEDKGTFLQITDNKGNIITIEPMGNSQTDIQFHSNGANINTSGKQLIMIKDNDEASTEYKIKSEDANSYSYIHNEETNEAADNFYIFENGMADVSNNGNSKINVHAINCKSMESYTAGSGITEIDAENVSRINTNKKEGAKGNSFVNITSDLRRVGNCSIY